MIVFPSECPWSSLVPYKEPIKYDPVRKWWPVQVSHICCPNYHLQLWPPVASWNATASHFLSELFFFIIIIIHSTGGGRGERGKRRDPGISVRNSVTVKVCFCVCPQLNISTNGITASEDARRTERKVFKHNDEGSKCYFFSQML